MPGENSLPIFVSDECGGFGIYRTWEAAEEVFNHPEEHLGFLGEAVEAFHAMAVPYAYHGKVDRRGEFSENATFAVAPSDPGGPLMVLKAAGYDNPGSAEIPRIAKFYGAVIEVRDYYATLPGNFRAAVYSGTRVDGGSGVTPLRRLHRHRGRGGDARLHDARG